jgi:CDP-diglyceride synthetase
VTTGDEPNMNTIAKAEVPGLTKAQNPLQIVLLITVSIITVWTLYMVPSWQAPGDPFLLAAVVGAVTVACLWLTRWLGSRAMKFERTMLAAFLVGMPLVYVMGWFAARDHAASSWIWVELLGLALFTAFAALGLKNSPWFLAVGIVAHGLAWDTWHYRNSTYIPDWYATACLAVDLAFGAYVAAHVPAYQSASRNTMS